MNVQQAHHFACTSLTESGGESPKVDADFLLARLFNKNQAWFKTWPEHELSAEQELQLRAMVARRIQGEPIAYIVGQREFWTLVLETNPSTLIPRPETELLVEQSLEFLQPLKKAKVLDLGTGTGAVALAIASERCEDDIFASDVNADAVALAKRNQERNRLSNVYIGQSDWYVGIDQTDFDLIVSNPPYVSEGDLHLWQGDLVFEPGSALVAGENGFADIKIIVEEAPCFLRDGGGLMLEHGFEQGRQVREILHDNGFGQIKTIQDLAGLDRVTIGVRLD